MQAEQLLQFTQQLTTLISAGVPLLQALNSLASGMKDGPAKAEVLELHQRIAQGHSLHHALEASGSFDHFYCQLIAAGEISGDLEGMLERLVLHLKRQQQLHQQVRAALVYPASVLLIALLVVAVILIWVVPVFQTIFASFGAELPWATRLVLATSQGLLQWGVPVCLGLFTLALLVKHVHVRSPSLQMNWARIQLRLPIVNALMRLSNLAIWTRCMATLVRSSVPLLDSLEVTAGVCPNRCFGLATLGMRQAVSQGRSMAWAMHAMTRNPSFPKELFPSMLVQMVRIGEEAGALAQLLDKAATDQEQRLAHQVQAMTQLIEPLMVVLLGGLVGGLVVALYLPVFQLGQIF